MIINNRRALYTVCVYVVFVVSCLSTGIFSIYVRFDCPDCGEGRLFLDHWPVFTVGIVAIAVCAILLIAETIKAKNLKGY